MDRLSVELDTRYECGDSELAVAERALLTGDPDAVGKTCAFYGLDTDRVQFHISMLHDICEANNLPLKTTQDVRTALLDLGLQKQVPECVQLLRLILTAPATTCTAERSFSLLRRVKTWLRSTMKQERLNHTAICAAYDEDVISLDRLQLLSEFISRTPQRNNRFAQPGQQQRQQQ